MGSRRRAVTRVVVSYDDGTYAYIELDPDVNKAFHRERDMAADGPRGKVYVWEEHEIHWKTQQEER